MLINLEEVMGYNITVTVLEFTICRIACKISGGRENFVKQLTHHTFANLRFLIQFWRKSDII